MNQETNYEFFIDKINANISSEIKDGMNKINEKHQEYFDGRITRFGELDKLSNHYLIGYPGNGIILKFDDDTDLDQNIIDECIEFLKDLGLKKL